MKLPTIGNNGMMWLMMIVTGTLLLISTTESAPPVPSSGYYSPLAFEGQNPEYILQTLARLRQALIAEEDLEKLCGTAQKRNIKNLDFGMGRGHSGALEAQYRMAIDSAYSPHGPGRRKRSTDDSIQKICDGFNALYTLIE